MKIILFSILGIFSLHAYCDDKVNVEMQTVTCANNYKLTSKSTVADITKNCNTEELKNKHGLINKNKGQEIKFKATTEVDMKCQFDNNGLLKTCKIDD